MTMVKKRSLQLVSWNVNGVRAVFKKGFLDWLNDTQPSVVAIQETKAHVEQLSEELTQPPGYETYWFSAERKGYSGLGFYIKKSEIKIDKIETGLGIPKFDQEGRVQVLYFHGYALVNAYFPNSQRDHARLPFKLEFNNEFLKFCDGLRKKGLKVITCGDFNVAHQEIDLKNPKTNGDTAGFLPQERKWMGQFLAAGYIDSFRQFFPNKSNQYTWWSFRKGVREKNIGWRLDYFCVSEDMKGLISKPEIFPAVHGSDHCPVGLRVNY